MQTGYSKIFDKLGIGKIDIGIILIIISSVGIEFNSIMCKNNKQ